MNGITDFEITSSLLFQNDEEISESIRSLNVTQRQIFDYVLTWAKEKVKQKRSIKPKAVKPFNLFISGSGGVRKSDLMKTICLSVTRLLQYHDSSPEIRRVLILASTGLASINVNSTTVHSLLGLPCRGKLFPLDSNILAALRNKYAEVILVEILMVSKKIVLSNALLSYRNS